MRLVNDKYIKVRVLAGGKTESVTKVADDTYKIVTKLPAKQNLANNRVAELLREEFGEDVKSIRLVSGHHSPGKIYSINI